MSRNYYSEINYHITWHTRESLPLLSEEVEQLVFAAIREKAAKLGAIYLHELGAISTHVHIALSTEPTVTPSQLVGELKGYASHEVNRRLGVGRKILQWQTGYGIVSYGTRDGEWVCEYVRRQKEHHASGRVFNRLEAINQSEG